MRLGVTFVTAFRALRRNKMRSMLTALGIIIGVGAFIAMVGIGNGAKSQVEAQIASMGDNVMLIFSGSVDRGGKKSGIGGASTLTELQSRLSAGTKCGGCLPEIHRRLAAAASARSADTLAEFEPLKP